MVKQGVLYRMCHTEFVIQGVLYRCAIQGVPYRICLTGCYTGCIIQGVLYWVCYTGFVIQGVLYRCVTQDVLFKTLSIAEIIQR